MGEGHGALEGDAVRLVVVAVVSVGVGLGLLWVVPENFYVLPLLVAMWVGGAAGGWLPPVVVGGSGTSLGWWLEHDRVGRSRFGLGAVAVGALGGWLVGGWPEWRVSATAGVMAVVLSGGDYYFFRRDVRRAERA